jgi:hypothetical protein
VEASRLLGMHVPGTASGQPPALRRRLHLILPPAREQCHDDVCDEAHRVQPWQRQQWRRTEAELRVVAVTEQAACACTQVGLAATAAAAAATAAAATATTGAVTSSAAAVPAASAIAAAGLGLGHVARVHELRQLAYA